MAETKVSVIPRLREVHYDVFADFPIVGVSVGDLAYATDHEILYRWNGAAWDGITHPWVFGGSVAGMALQVEGYGLAFAVWFMELLIALDVDDAADVFEHINLSEAKAEAVWNAMGGPSIAAVDSVLNTLGVSKVLEWGIEATWKTVGAPGAPNCYGMGGSLDTVWHTNSTAALIYELSEADLSDIRNAAAPGTTPADIGGTALVIWSIDRALDNTYELSIVDFSVVRTGGTPGTYTLGMGGDDSHIWHTDTATDQIYELSIVDFSVVRNAAGPATQTGGIGGDGSVIFLSDGVANRIYDVSIVDFSIVKFLGAWGSPRGCGGDVDVFWHCDNVADEVYQLGVD